MIHTLSVDTLAAAVPTVRQILIVVHFLLTNWANIAFFNLH